MDSKKFIVGNTYRYTDWFTAGKISMMCQSISENRKQIEFKVADWEIDGLHYRTEKFELLSDNGNEYVLIYSYKGEENRMRA